MPDHSASDSASGFLYQVRYALLAALQRSDVTPGLQISLECFDDIAFSEGDKVIELLQAKHSFVPRKQSDMGKQFWKTIGIWTSRIINDPSQLGRVALKFVTTATLSPDHGITLLRPAGMGRDVGKAQVKIEKAAEKIRNQDIVDAVNLFLSQPPELRFQIFNMIEILDDSPNALSIEAEIAKCLKRTCRPHNMGLLVERLEGWWYATVLQTFSSKQSMHIPVSIIDSKIDDLREEFGPDKLPIDYGNTDPSQQLIGILESRAFVGQLQLIAIGPTGQRVAVLHYFRARQQRSRWARDGLLKVNELSNYSKKLSEQWAQRRGLLEGKVKIGMSTQQLVDLGQELYIETTAICVPLREIQEPFVSHGSYHILSDKGSIGWHPEYHKHFEESGKPEDDDTPLE